jgi:mitochondrial import inner membrane translocase subunit TIM50
MLGRAAMRAATGAAARQLPSVRSAALKARLAAPPAMLAPFASRGMAKDHGPKQGSRFSSPSSKNPRSNPSMPPDDRPMHAQPKPNDSTQPFLSSHRPAASDTKPDFESEPEIPLDQLPDLTRGIPSTLEYETAGASSRSSVAKVDEPTSGGRGKGELPASAYISSSERRRQKLANYSFGIFVALAAAGTIYAGRNWDEEDAGRHPDVPNGWGLGLWWNRATTRVREVLTYYHEPAFEKLLPDPDPMYDRPYTLCISLEDMLVHSEWTREHGWRIAKRPGVDYFLRYLSQYYELVLFTTVPFAIGEPLMRKLDPFHFLVYPLYREATKYKDGEIVKVRTSRGCEASG